MVPDVFVGAALELDGDEREWVPQSPTVAFRPLVFNVSQGYYINILRVRSSGVLSRHRHSGPVHAITLRYVDPYGEALGYEDVFTKLEHATRHYEAVGLGTGHVKRIVR
jgi:hypothetical protein